MRDNERGRKRKLIGHKRIERENERGLKRIERK